MSGRAGATSTARPSSDGRAHPPALRVRPPSPLSTGARAAIAVVAVVLLVGGAALVRQASVEDRGGYAGDEWRADLRPPRAARIDGFDVSGAPGTVDGFGTWSASSPGWTAAEGMVVSTSDDPGTLHVPTDTDQLLVYAQVVTGNPGGGVTIGVPRVDPGTVGLQLVVDAAGTGWQLERIDANGRVVLASFDQPTSRVAVQLTHVGTRAVATFDGAQQSVELPAGDQVGRSAGLVAVSPGTAFDLVGYLPLA